jgi:hypothetical protein
VSDPQVFELLDVARAMFEHHLVSLQAMADEDAAELDALSPSGQQ